MFIIFILFFIVKFVKLANKRNIKTIKQSFGEINFTKRIQNEVISIVMAYYNRKPQTLETLKGFQRMYAGKYNFEVVIVDDNSNDDNRLEEDIKQFTFPINLIVISAEEKGDRINPCTAYNKGFAKATGDIIIIQNPECYHIGDILKHTLEILDEQDYFSYSCFTSNSPEITKEMIESDNVFELIKNQEFLDKNKSLLGLNWYNHPSEPGRDTAYHFCCAIYKSKLDLIGGFDKRFADGYCFDDDQLLLAVKYNLKLNIIIIEPEKCFVIHQYHTRNASMNCEYEDDNHPIKRKWLKNKQLFEKIKNNHLQNDFVYPKLMFLYWDGSPLSYYNYLTVESFNKYNPGWNIIIFSPNKRTKKITWKTNEQKLKYTGKCYFDKLFDIDNVIVKKISLDDIGFYDDASEVIKSDYFRYYILEKHGGLWSDFDIIYTASIEEKMNFKTNSVIFKCNARLLSPYKNNPPLAEWIKTRATQLPRHCFPYFPVGLFLTKYNSKIFKYIKSQCQIYYDKNEYQCIGSSMLKTIFNDSESEVYKIDKNIQICDQDYYLPFETHYLAQYLYSDHNTILHPNNIGIHWYNGFAISRDYANKLDKRLNSMKYECYMDKHILKYLNNDFQ